MTEKDYVDLIQGLKFIESRKDILIAELTDKVNKLTQDIKFIQDGQVEAAKLIADKDGWIECVIKDIVAQCDKFELINKAIVDQNEERKIEFEV